MLSFSFILTAGILGIGFPAPPLRELLSEAVSEPVSMSISFRNLEATMCAYAAGAAVFKQKAKFQYPLLIVQHQNNI
jgi:hypothetical protein